MNVFSFWVARATCVSLLVAIALLGCTRNATRQNEASWLDGKWPYEKSTLPRHEAALYGRLDNGLRYIIQKNARPEGRAEVHLDVQVGSLMEKDNELGLAHYLEHMAFNGSRNFAPGELIPFFQKNGLAFGRDANAHTSVLETVYKLSLASTEQENMDQGLLVMRDVADGLSILEEEVEKERGVIMSEKAARDSVEFRARMRNQDWLYSGTRFNNAPIGTEEIILGANAEVIRGFYNAWYRPELMILVVVGDIEPESVEQSIRKMFSDLKPHGEARELQPWGDIQISGLNIYYDHYSTKSTNVGIRAMKSREWRDDSMELQREMLLQSMANRIVSKRLEALRSKGEAPFFRAVAQHHDAFGLFSTATIIANCDAGKWEQTLTTLQDELRRAEIHGFAQTELDLVRQEYTRYFEIQTKREADIPHDKVAESMVNSFNANRVYQSMSQTEAMYSDMMAEATTQDLHNAFKAMWKSDNRIVNVTGNAVIEGAPEQKLTSLWNAGLERDVAPVMNLASLAYPYVHEPQSHGVHTPLTTTRLPGSELMVFDTVFKNGLKLRMLPTPYQQGQVALTLVVKGGTNTIDDPQYDQFLVADQVNSASGIGRLRLDEQQRLFLTKGFRVRMSFGQEALTLAGSGQTDESQEILQAMWTEFRAPEVTENDRKRVIDQLSVADADRGKNVPSVMRSKGTAFFQGDSLYTQPLTAQRAQAVSIAQIRAALKRMVRTGEATLLVVGDFKPDQMTDQVAGFFGAPEVQWEESASSEHIRGPIYPHESSVEGEGTAPADLNQAALWMGYPRRFDDVNDRQALTTRQLVSSLIRDRLRVQVREEMGATYSPSMSYLIDDRNGYGMYLARINTQPDQLKALRAAMEATFADIARKGFTQEELDRQKRPMLTGWEKNREINRRYLGLLTAKAIDGLPYLAWDAEFPERVNAVSLDDLNREARAAFRPEKQGVYIGRETGAAVN